MEQEAYRHVPYDIDVEQALLGAILADNRAMERVSALIKPDEIIQDTRTDEAFVLVRGTKPLRCGRAIYFRRRDMAPLVAANRFHPQRQAAE